MGRNKYHRTLLEYFFYGLIAVFVVTSFTLDTFSNSISGLLKIIATQEVLITDYFKIGGLGAACLNTALVTTLSIVIIKINHIKIDSLAFTSLLTLIGFSFFGKNIYNIIPIYFGVYLYSLYSKQPFREYFLVAVFSTCLAPLIGSNFLGNTFGLFLSIFMGVLYGFVIVPLARLGVKFHDGYTLYNVGFAGGLFAVIIASVLRTLGIELETVNFISTQYHFFLTVFIAIISLLFIILAFIDKHFSFREYVALTKKSGQATTDYFALFDNSIVYLNIGIMGLIALGISLLSGIPLNGPIIGAILTVMGFSVFGISPINSIIVIIGCYIMFTISNDTMSTETLLTILFVAGVAPIAGDYGIFFGLLAGMLHYCVVNFSSSWQGAINLYNNGFASGIVAGVMVNILENLREIKRTRQCSKKPNFK